MNIQHHNSKLSNDQYIPLMSSMYVMDLSYHQ